MGPLLALASSLSYGLSDFFGGVLSRRISFLRVALLGQLGGLVALALVAPLVSSVVPSVRDLVWGGVSGFGTGVAMLFLFRGMSRGAMSIVVPVSAVGGVALPVLVGVAVLGDRPTPLAWLGIAVALPALWSVARGSATGRPQADAAVPDGLLAGGGIALQYLALAQAGPASGIWPVVAGRVASVVVVAIVTVIARPPPDRGRGRRLVSLLSAALPGVLAGLALTCFLLATRAGSLTVAVVLSSLYPLIPVLLGVTALDERLTRPQICGLVGALACAVLIATG